jgi:hypothetical protein
MVLTGGSLCGTPTHAAVSNHAVSNAVAGCRTLNQWMVDDVKEQSTCQCNLSPRERLPTINESIDESFGHEILIKVFRIRFD